MGYLKKNIHVHSKEVQQIDDNKKQNDHSPD